jgi:hypothetical protein
MGAASTACVDHEGELVSRDRPGDRARDGDDDRDEPRGDGDLCRTPARRSRRSTVVEDWLIERPIPLASPSPAIVSRRTLAGFEPDWAIRVHAPAGPTRPSTPPRPRPRQVAGPRRVGRRPGRRIAAGALLLIGVVLGVAALSAASGDTPPDDVHDGPRPVASVAYVVRAGDTLWSIAREIQPQGDVRPLVDVLSAQRDGAPLEPGDVVAWPPLPKGR